MRVLLTGAAGFIGSNTAEALLARGDRVVGVDNFNAFYDPSLKHRNVAMLSAEGGDRFVLATGDITDEPFLDALFASHRFDAIVHLAAWAGVRPSILTPGVYVDVNVRGTMNVLERARRHDVRRIVFASSSSVYGGRAAGPFRESDPVDHPISPYAATKRAGEVLCSTWHQLYGLDIAALRYFTVYGPRQRPEMAIHKFARLLARGEPVTMFGDGSSVRDYTYVDDVVEGTIRALDHSRGFEIYNLGEERTTTLRTLIDRIALSLGVPVRIQQEAIQPGDVPLTCADVTKAREMIGYRPTMPIELGIDRFVEWFRREGVH